MLLALLFAIDCNQVLLMDLKMGLVSGLYFIALIIGLILYWYRS
jgi:hypothetical protein